MKKSVTVLAVLGSLFMILGTIIGIVLAIIDAGSLAMITCFPESSLGFVFCTRKVIHAIFFMVCCILVAIRSRRDRKPVLEIISLIYFGVVSLPVTMILGTTFQRNIYNTKSNLLWTFYNRIAAAIVGIIPGGAKSMGSVAIIYYDYYVKADFHKVQFLFVWALCCFAAAAALSIFDARGKRTSNIVFVIVASLCGLIGIIVGIVPNVSMLVRTWNHSRLGGELFALIFILRRIVHMLVLFIIGIILIVRNKKQSTKIVPICIITGYLAFVSPAFGCLVNRYSFMRNHVLFGIPLNKLSWLNDLLLMLTPGLKSSTLLDTSLTVYKSYIKYYFARADYWLLLALILTVIAAASVIYNRCRKETAEISED